MKQLIILLFLCRSLSVVAAQSSMIAVDVIRLPGANTQFVKGNGAMGTLCAGSGIVMSNDSIRINTDSVMTVAAATPIISAMQGNIATKADTVRTLSINSVSYNLAANRSWTLKIPATYSGTTNSSGVYTVTYGTPYSTAPNIQANITNQSNTNQFIRVTAVSTTGFTINVYQRNSVNLLGIDVLLSATANVNGATVDALVTEK